MHLVRCSAQEWGGAGNLDVWRAMFGGALVVLEPLQNLNGVVLVEEAAAHDNLGG